MQVYTTTKYVKKILVASRHPGGTTQLLLPKKLAREAEEGHGKCTKNGPPNRIKTSKNPSFLSSEPL